ncbi:glycosyltransferase family 39 protein [Patescibacteria group bacterium]|nr:glycosyltransferase family 39 protein [Patescibacteria group bacterium]MCL5409934.1 glycosyltransferase family 39 protein [Patescibacteria group bacterium]
MITRLITRYQLIFLFLSLAIFIAICLRFLLVYPAVWPDEAIYADIAKHYLAQNRLGTDLWGNTIPGIHDHAYWYPPVFFFLINLWINIFGVNIQTQRLLSVLAGGSLLVVVYLLTKQLLQKHSKKSLFLVLFSIYPVFLLISNARYLNGAKVSRPEIFLLFFGLVAVYLYLSPTLHKYKTLQPISVGFLMSLSYLTHFIAFFFPLAVVIHRLVIHKKMILRDKFFYLFLVAFLIPIILWLISIYPDYNILYEQVRLAIDQKVNTGTTMWIHMYLKLNNLPTLVNYFIYIFLTWEFCFAVLVKKQATYYFWAIILVLSWVFSLYGRMSWYVLIPLPFLAITLSIYAHDNIQQIKKPFLSARNYYQLLIISGVCLVLVLSIVDLVSNYDIQYSNQDYYTFGQQLSNFIPQDKKVLLISLPDAYFSLEKQGYSLYEFPVLPTSRQNIAELVNQADYVVLNYRLGTSDFIDYINPYLQLNTLASTRIGTTSGYQATVIELKNKNERTEPQQ